MIRYALADLRSHGVRFALTVVAVLLGVALATGGMVLGDTARAAYAAQLASGDGADLTVRTATAFDSGMGVDVERHPVDPGVVDRILAVDGVSAAVPVARGRTRVQRGDVDLGQISVTGAPTQDADELVVDAGTLEAWGLSVGDTVTLAGDERVDVRIARTVEGGRPGSSAVVATATAQAVLGLGGAFSEVRVSTTGDTRRVQRALAAALGPDLQMASSRDLAAAGAEAAAANVEMLQTVLVGVSAAALVIGMLLISNSFRMSVAQRRRERALLHIAGATGGQVLATVLVEALLLGVVAAALGVVAGVGGAVGLRELARAVGIAIPDGGLVVMPLTVGLAFVAGVVVTVLAALGPARRAGRTGPMPALRAGSSEPRRLGAVRLAGGAVVLVAGAVLAAAPALGLSAALLVPGYAGILVGVVLLAPGLVAPFLAVVRAVRPASLTLRLTADAGARAPQRSAAPMVALAFSLALMCFVAVVGTSVQAATGAQYREVVVADAVVESTGQEMLGGLHEGVYDAVAEMTEVQTAVRLKYGHWLDAGRASALSAFDPASIGRVVGIRMADGGLDALTRDGVVIAEGLAEERGLTVGDRLPMTFARTGDQALPIVGVMRDEAAHALQIDVAMSLEGTGEHFTEDMDASVFLVARAGVSAEALTEAVADALISHPTARVRDQQAVIAGRTQALDEIFGLLSVLLVFATVIAALGVANTLALSVLERTRELGLLRLVGLDRIRAAALVQTAAFALSVLAALLGAALGVGAAIAAVGALSQAAPLDVTAPWPQLLSCTAIVVLAGLLAGVGPAIRAARTPVLAAVHAA